jgi:lysozyme
MDLPQLEKELIRDEGLKLKPYRCTAGKLTIGVGRNIEDTGITEAEAVALLRGDIARCVKELAFFPWFGTLDGVRQRVLINMNFNLGFNRFRQFAKMLLAIQNGKFDAAADEMHASKWARQVGSRATRLESMMRRGE